MPDHFLLEKETNARTFVQFLDITNEDKEGLGVSVCLQITSIKRIIHRHKEEYFNCD
jgi:hypothetical protein